MQLNNISDYYYFYFKETKSYIFCKNIFQKFTFMKFAIHAVPFYDLKNSVYHITFIYLYYKSKYAQPDNY